MRKIVLSLAAISLLTATTWAAPVVQKKVQFGFKAGLSLSNTTGDSLNDIDAESLMSGSTLKQSSNLGFAAGAFVTLKLTPMFALQPEVLYAQKGVKFAATIPDVPVPILGPTDVDLDGKMKVDYVEIPLLVKFLFPSRGPVKPALYAGPVASFKASSGLNAEYSASGVSMTVPDDMLQEMETGLDDSLQGTDFSVAFGGSLDITHIVLDVRYTMGMSNIVKDGDDYGVSTKNGVFNVFAGVVF